MREAGPRQGLRGHATVLNKGVDAAQFVPLLEKRGDTPPALVGDGVVFPQAAVVLLGKGDEAAGGFQPFENGVQGRFGNIDAGGDVADDFVSIGGFPLQNRQDTDFQQTFFPLCIQTGTSFAVRYYALYSMQYIVYLHA